MTATTMHAADRLVDAIERIGAPICVGLDPVVDRLPDALQPRPGDPAAAASAFEAFADGVLDACSGVVPCIKVQAACFERYGAAGFGALSRVVRSADERGFVVILDAKRGDIGISARHYAAMAFGDGAADWLTINGYLGPDTIEPFLDGGGAAFVLVRTSNPGSGAFQSLELADGRTVADAMADVVTDLARPSIGASGYGNLGAVIGATHPAETARLRERLPHSMLLIPGYGAQGGGAEDVRALFHPHGRGAVVTASRSVIYAGGAANWIDAVRAAAEQFAHDISSVCGSGRAP